MEKNDRKAPQSLVSYTYKSSRKSLNQNQEKTILPLLPLLPHATLSTFHSANKGLGAGSKEKVEKLSFIYNYIFMCLSAKMSGKTTKNA